MKREKPCGNPDCCVSTTIGENLSFGSGELDRYGFWEKPCSICARQNEKDYPEEGECWPFAEKNTRKE